MACMEHICLTMGCHWWGMNNGKPPDVCPDCGGTGFSSSIDEVPEDQGD